MSIAKVAASVVNILKKYIQTLEKNHIHIKSAILFGSYVKGNVHEWSDLDIALVSDDFEGIRFLDREKIADVTLSVDTRISPLTYRPEDFSEDDLFVQEILRTGIRIA